MLTYSKTHIVQACHETVRNLNLIVKCKCAYLKEQKTKCKT